MNVAKLRIYDTVLTSHGKIRLIEAAWPSDGGPFVYVVCGYNGDGEGIYLDTAGARRLADALRAFAGEAGGTCEHQIPEGNWCSACNTEYKRARAENEERADTR